MNIKNLRALSDKYLSDTQETYKLKKSFFSVLEYIYKNEWSGACHATTSILYILLREQGINVNRFVGEVTRENIIFDHSWLELDGSVIDAAISNTLIQGISFSPVLLGIELDTGEQSRSNYNYAAGGGIDSEIAPFLSQPFKVYMDGYPGHAKGLWGIAKDIGKKVNIRLNTEILRNKYGDESWCYKE